jgi:hypothetical protein
MDAKVSAIVTSSRQPGRRETARVADRDHVPAPASGMTRLRNVVGDITARFARAWHLPHSDGVAATHAQARKRSHIPHDATLVAGLKSDHRELLDAHRRIGELIAQRRFVEIPEQLALFKARLETHVLTENVRLYAFLEDWFRGDQQHIAVLNQFRVETNTVLLAALRFIRSHRRTTFDASRVLAFTDECRGVGTLLARHCAREERELYRLYP